MLRQKINDPRINGCQRQRKSRKAEKYFYCLF